MLFLLLPNNDQSVYWVAVRCIGITVLTAKHGMGPLQFGVYISLHSQIIIN